MSQSYFLVGQCPWELMVLSELGLYRVVVPRVVVYIYKVNEMNEKISNEQCKDKSN